MQRPYRVAKPIWETVQRQVTQVNYEVVYDNVPQVQYYNTYRPVTTFHTVYQDCGYWINQCVAMGCCGCCYCPVYVPNTVAKQVPSTHYVTETHSRTINVQVCRYVAKPVTYTVNVPVCRVEYEDRVQNVPVTTCRMVPYQTTHQVPYSVPRQVAYTSVIQVPVTVAKQIPVYCPPVCVPLCNVGYCW